MGYTYKYNEVKKNLLEKGYILEVDEPDFKGVTLTNLYCHDHDGFKYKVIYDQIIRGGACFKVHKSNQFSIYNINNYLKLNNVPFTCISSAYINKKQALEFECNRCGKIVISNWDKVNRVGENRRHIICPNCDNKKESLHASVLKQIFLHVYPDTIVEDPSYKNPITGKTCPTDIVNHRLKIAIEIQSQWHDFDDIRQKDVLKKSYWVNSGYTFYDPDIRNYTVLEMCQLFFDIDSLPSYIDYHYSDGINAKKVQDLLNDGYNVSEISNMINVSKHQIYDAVKSGKIYYPDNYIQANKQPVYQFTIDWTYIGEFETIEAAALANGVRPKSLASALREGRHYYKGFNWKYKKSA